MNLTDFYVDISAEISNTGTTTHGFFLNLVTNSSAAKDLSNQSITASGVYNSQWAGLSLGVNPVFNEIKCYTALYGNSTYGIAGSKGAYANLRTPLRLAVSVTNGSSLSVSYIF